MVHVWIDTMPILKTKFKTDNNLSTDKGKKRKSKKNQDS